MAWYNRVNCHCQIADKQEGARTRISRGLLAVAIIWFCASPTIATSQQATKMATPRPDQQFTKALTAEAVFKRVSPSVVVVESLDAKGSVVTLGSGVVIAQPSKYDSLARKFGGWRVSGDVVTNRHVIEDGIAYQVEQNGKTWPAKLIRVDPDHDLAELSVDGLDDTPLQVRNSSTLAVGEKVYAIGAPEGLELTISEGLISGLRDFDNGRVIQTSAAISPGSSGGGLFDAEGRLVGITTFYLKGGQSLNFALPAERIAALLERPKANAQAAASAWKAGLGWDGQALVFELTGNWQGLLELAQNWTAHEPAESVAWRELGDAYNHLGQRDKAVSAEQQAIRLKPEDNIAWETLGDAYDGLRQYDKAISSELKAIQLKPDDAEAWAALGDTYFHLGQYGKSADANREAVRLSPKYDDAWIALGFDYCAQGERECDSGLSEVSEVRRR